MSSLIDIPHYFWLMDVMRVLGMKLLFRFVIGMNETGYLISDKA